MEKSFERYFFLKKKTFFANSGCSQVTNLSFYRYIGDGNNNNRRVPRVRLQFKQHLHRQSESAFFCVGPHLLARILLQQLQDEQKPSILLFQLPYDAYSSKLVHSSVRKEPSKNQRYIYLVFCKKKLWLLQ